MAPKYVPLISSQKEMRESDQPGRCSLDGQELTRVWEGTDCAGETREAKLQWPTNIFFGEQQVTLAKEEQ